MVHKKNTDGSVLDNKIGHLEQGAHGVECVFVVGVLGHFAEHFCVRNAVVFVDDKYGAHEQVQLFDAYAVRFAKRTVFVIGEHRNR